MNALSHTHVSVPIRDSKDGGSPDKNNVGAEAARHATDSKVRSSCGISVLLSALSD